MNPPETEVVAAMPEDSEEPVTGTPDTLTIASLGIEAPVIYIEERGETVYQEALQRGVVHYPGTALPGQAGNVYIFGHSSDFLWSKGDYKTVFALLPNIKMGDSISLSDAVGRVYVYKVTETHVVNPSEMWVLDQYQNEKKLLTLQTSYPLGTALQRFIVRAELQN